MEYSIQGNIRLVLFSLLSPLLLAGEFQCLKLSLFQQNYVRANSRWDETVCESRRAKTIWGKTVFRIRQRTRLTCDVYINTSNVNVR